MSRTTGPRRILVTGAGGFVGRHLLPALRTGFPGARLIAASRRGPVPGADETVPLDLLDEAGAAAVASLRPDAVVHLAAQAAVSESFADPIRTWRVNLLGTVALGEALLRHAPEAVLLLASSAEVYGLSFQSGEALDEEAALRPANPYAASKAAADLAVGEMSLRGLRTVRLRPFNQIGPGQSAAFVVPSFARQVARIAAGLQESVVRVGALDRWRDFLDVRDVCAAYVAALRAAPDLLPGAVFNIASGVPRRVGDILEAMISAAGIAPEVQVASERLRPTDVLRTVGIAARARRQLDWSPGIPWEETLASVLADWRERISG